MTMTVTENTVAQQEVELVFAQFCDAYGTKNVEKFLSLYAEGDNRAFIGTGEEEWSRTKEEQGRFLERDFRQSGNIKLRPDVRSVQIFGDTACLAAHCVAAVEVDGGVFNISGRFTCTMHRYDGAWKLVQAHYSAPLATQQEGNSFGDV